jgi:hypothetical protein
MPDGGRKAKDREKARQEFHPFKLHKWRQRLSRNRAGIVNES